MLGPYLKDLAPYLPAILSPDFQPMLWPYLPTVAPVVPQLLPFMEVIFQVALRPLFPLCVPSFFVHLWLSF